MMTVMMMWIFRTWYVNSFPADEFEPEDLAAFQTPVVETLCSFSF
jgi:hypothetical protein